VAPIFTTGTNFPENETQLTTTYRTKKSGLLTTASPRLEPS